MGGKEARSHPATLLGGPGRAGRRAAWRGMLRPPGLRDALGALAGLYDSAAPAVAQADRSLWRTGIAQPIVPVGDGELPAGGVSTTIGSPGAGAGGVRSEEGSFGGVVSWNST